jgi:hypothetical protein
VNYSIKSFTDLTPDELVAGLKNLVRELNAGGIKCMLPQEPIFKIVVLGTSEQEFLVRADNPASALNTLFKKCKFAERVSVTIREVDFHDILELT